MTERWQGVVFWLSVLVFAGLVFALGFLLEAVARQVARAINTHLEHTPDGVPDLVERAYRIVHAEYGLRLRVPLLARRLGVSAAHLSRTFHHATGLRLVDYVARYRAERARALLGAEEVRPVATVAKACGFTSISQFNRVFRATFDASPRSLRPRVALVASAHEAHGVSGKTR